MKIENMLFQRKESIFPWLSRHSVEEAIAIVPEADALGIVACALPELLGSAPDRRPLGRTCIRHWGRGRCFFGNRWLDAILSAGRILEGVQGTSSPWCVSRGTDLADST